MNYETIIQKIRAVASIKVAMMTGPAPMDIGNVECQTCVDLQIDEEEVRQVCMTQWHGCGGGLWNFATDIGQRERHATH